MANAGQRVTELSEEDFATQTKEPGWCLVDFYATWCPHCRAFRPVLEEVAAAHAGPVKFFAADVEKCSEAAQQFSVRSVPTLVLLREGAQAEKEIGGMTAEKLSDWLEKKTAI